MKMFMTIGSVILFLIGGGLLLFSILFILAAFSPEQPDSLLFVGLVMAVIALGCIGGGIALVFAARKQAASETASGPGGFRRVLQPVNVDSRLGNVTATPQ